MKKTCPNAIDGRFHIVKPNGCVTCANADEMKRFNDRVSELRAAKTPLLIDSPESMNHGDEVLYIDSSFDLHTKRPKDSAIFSRTWAYCNDGRWAKLLARAGVERHPMNAAFTARQ